MTALSFLLCIGAAPTSQPTLIEPATQVALMTDADKLALIEHYFDTAAPASRAWFWTWLSVFATATAVQSVLAIYGAATGNITLRNSGIVSAVQAGIGVILHSAIPLTSAFSDGDFHHGTLQGSAKLHWAEQRLDKDAAAARFGRGWLAHVGGAALSTAAGLILLVGFHQPIDALLAFVSSLAVAELRIWTQPMRAVDNATAYKQRLSVDVVVHPGGLGVAFAW